MPPRANYIGPKASNQFLVNFVGARDAYHLPSALHAEGQLAALVTDIYSDHIPNILKSGRLAKWGTHRSDRLNGANVIGSRRAAAMQILHRLTARFGLDGAFLVDGLVDRKTSELWKNYPSNLLLYSGYAEHTFYQAVGSVYSKGLFQFHPHHRLVSKILRADAESYPDMMASFENDNELAATWRHERGDRELDLADYVICASTFSARSVSEYRRDIRTEIVPYFSEIASNPTPDVTRNSGTVDFLFVGQGVQRKGLHHLFIAWKKASLKGARLTCVCSRMDAAIAAMVPKGVEILKGLKRDDLTKLYDRSSVFVMPSLVEGFGLVYLEAAKRGAAVIATSNTGVPDMNMPDGGFTLTIPGNVDDLVGALDQCFQKAKAKLIDHRQIVESANIYDFTQYRLALMKAMKTV